MNAIENKHATTFTFKAPFAGEVLLAGDFTRWLANPMALERQENGVWRINAFLAPGTYHYRFYVDNEWRNDPNSKVRVQNVFGSQDDLIQIPGKTAQSTAAQINSPAAVES